MTTTTAHDLSTFAAAVLDAGRRTPPAGRVGSKAWVHAVWAIGRFNEGLIEFKRLLIECNRRGLLSLSRCDLPEAFDPHDVRRSGISHLGAEYNFIRIA